MSMRYVCSCRRGDVGWFGWCERASRAFSIVLKCLCWPCGGACIDKYTQVIDTRRKNEMHTAVMLDSNRWSCPAARTTIQIYYSSVE